MSSTTYGFIACNIDERSYEQAERAIDALPLSGKIIVRDLFHLIPRSRSFSYYMNMITFGIDQKDDWCVDPGFIEEFENFLCNLDWSHAEVIHAYTGTKVSWQRKLSVDHNYMPRDKFIRTSYGSIHDLKEIEL